MKLEKFKTESPKKKAMIIGSIILVLLVTIVVVYRSFAFYENKQEFNVIKGSVPDQNYDIMLSLTEEDENGNKRTINQIPKKEEEQKYEVSITCNNEASGIWNYDEWKPEISNYTTTRTKCNINFKENNEFVYPASGKALIAAAITEKGVETSIEDSFEQMAENIKNINGTNSEIVFLSGFTPGSTYTFSDDYSYIFVSVYNAYISKYYSTSGIYTNFDITFTSSTATIDYNKKRNYPWTEGLYVSSIRMGIRNVSKGDILSASSDQLFADGVILAIK